MSKLIETKLQRFVLLLGGILISVRLYNVGYRERYEAMFEAIGIAVLTFVLLAILRGYQPKFHIRIWNFIKKYRIVFILVLVLILLILGVRTYQIWQVKRAEAEAATAYQDCLDKVALMTTWHRESDSEVIEQPSSYIPIPNLNRLIKEDRIVAKNKYFEEWIDAGRPYYNQQDHWEIAFMTWMMKNHQDFCNEYNPDYIRHHIDRIQELRETKTL